MKKNIYVSDLDGTLLNTDSALSRDAIEGLNQLIEKDVMIIFASARGSGSMINVLEGVKIRYPLIECNGAYITDARTREHIGINRIASKAAEKVLDIFSLFDKEPMVSCNHKDRDNIYYSKYSNDAMKRFFEGKIAMKDDRITKLDDIKKSLLGDVVSFNFIGQKEELDLIYAKLKKECPEVSPVIVNDHEFEGLYWLMINSVDATKGTGIKMLLEILEIKDYRLTVFGDNLNDIPMFKIADYAVATENANDALKELAHEIIGHCNSDSVANYIMGKELMD